MANRKFTDEQIEYIRENAEGTSNNDLLKMVKVKFGLNMKLQQLKDLKYTNRIISNHGYTKEQIDYLREISPGRYNKEITNMFNEKFNQNRTEKAIEGIRKRNSIKTNIDTTFQKGHKTWNKGTKGLMKPNKTSFKKGQMPHNWVPVGTKRLTKDGYIQVKIREGQAQKNWRGKHTLIWEKENGPLPDGHAVIFGDGNRRNFDLDNLILVSRKQLLGLNRDNLIQDDAKLTEIALNIVDLKYKIHERLKED